ncbi:uncharacterized protein [Watersipora subatra]|uniref:uncharacterized protein n=1 Tax=Watersipora subatra TaxID=2589382 RepID=UPI00355AD392
MGVKELWPLLTPVACKKSFDDISGQKVAIDLSIWVVDSQCVKQMMGAVTRPHLRNLFFRTSALLHANILPVFVIDGKAPELKWQVMAERQNQRHGRRIESNSGKTSARRANRSQFSSVIKECCEMLGYLGVPIIMADGEAEATCAALNSHGLVDAVITDDGDAFLYGARTVYRNFTTTKTPSVESYTVLDIEKEVKLTRSHLIALSILIGCDYCPKGVPGVGKTLAIKFCTEVSGDDILKKLEQWATRGLSGTETSAETLIATKICNMTANNFSQMLTEFANKSCKVPAEVGIWRKPLISKAQAFHLAKMEWPLNYSLEKMLPLLTLWTFKHLREYGSSSGVSIQPHRIVKKRVRQGVECLEVEWHVSDSYVSEDDAEPLPLVTVEPLVTMERWFARAVEEFNSSKAMAKLKKGKLPTSKEGTSQQISQTKSNHTLSKRPPPKLILPKPRNSISEADTIPGSAHVLSEWDTEETTANKLTHYHSNQIRHANHSNYLSEPQELPYEEIEFSIEKTLPEWTSKENPNNLLNDQDMAGKNNCDEISLNSIDELLADISEQLKTPNRNEELNSSITGQFTPEDFNALSRTAESDGYEMGSELSLLTLNSSTDFEVASMSNSPPIKQSVIESTPLRKEKGRRITYGQFDLDPQLSSLSLSDMRSYVNLLQMAGNHTRRQAAMRSGNGTVTGLHHVPQYHQMNPCCAASLEACAAQAELESRYRGGIDTRQAAQIIQTSFKQYTLSKNFARLRNTHDELRVQRLLMSDIASDKDSVWSDVAVTSQPDSPQRPSTFTLNNLQNASRDENSLEFSAPPSPDSFQAVADEDDDSLSYVKSHSTSDSRLHDIQLRYSNCSGRSRKRQYRIGLNLFNRKPTQGIRYLMEHRFLANSARAVAEFLIGRKGLSKQMIGEYLGNISTSFNQDVLVCMIQQLNFADLEIDQALRQLIHLFRLPGESQKIERIMERFAQWYCVCNPSYTKLFNSVDTIFLVSYAIIMVNTDLHNPNIKSASKMKLEAFIRNLRMIDQGKDIPIDMLTRIYNRISENELRVGPDHVSQVRKVERTMVGNVPSLAIPERRLVCYCRLYELSDPNKKEKLHQREIFLFNDLLVITKIYAKKKDAITYSYKRTVRISDVIVQCFTTEHYQYGIKLVYEVDRVPLIYFNARNNHDRDKFVDDLIDSIAELKEMRVLQSMQETKKSVAAQSRMSKDSGVGDLESRKSAEIPQSQQQSQFPLASSQYSSLPSVSQSANPMDRCSKKTSQRTDYRLVTKSHRV